MATLKLHWPCLHVCFAYIAGEEMNYWLKRGLLVLTVVVLLVGIAGCTSSSSPTATPTAQATATPQPTYVPKSTPGYLNYTNRSAGVAIQYPSSWNVTEGGVNITVLFTLPGTAVAFSVGTEDLSGVKPSLDEYAQLSLSVMKENATNLVVLNSTNTTLAGYPCLLYTSPSPRDRQKSRMPS